MSEDEPTADEGEANRERNLDAIRDRLGALEADLEDFEADLESADTEDDLNVVEADLESVREDVEDVEIPDPPETDDDEDDEPAPEAKLQDRYDDLESDLGDLEDDLEDQRGPYAEDVVGEIDGVANTITNTRWTVEGDEELIEAVDSFLTDVNDLLESDLSTPGDLEPASGAELGENAEEEGTVPQALEETLEEATAAVEDASPDPDEDAETIAGLLEATDDFEGGVDDATEWTDLEVREQLRREGFYDVLAHVKDFPPEWHALKVHEKRGNVDQILLAYETLGSEYMEEHCLEALERMGPEDAIEPMVQKAGRRDEAAIRILGKIGVADDEVVDALLDYVDSNPDLQKPAFRALGEIGAESAVQPLANQLLADNPDVRSWAARALGLIGDTRAIDPLADVLADDEEDRVRASAAWALNCIGTADALEIVAGYEDDRAYLVQAEATRVDLEPAA
ncbi:HEAT repeat domain-containing protein [Natronobacterium gregoryi]|uniref:PBS lyase HEAT domain-containing protein repeat-containing protein n=2 Tax=Natronobacterium gregoryi TaxID=44930 RepID=L0AE32_NATGS|nr:HEAT repeat domain-containing protein [Natronobacterium gregoryi]AFZ72158.1 PBS lyase HEAT-like repeat protein [Natronobacterium gregoryi SP2]ELY63069.1 PBS lyase HEAT domain-containing protein repeat-containing protein [Natronobacterium gregoryi SP2]PLK20105.1 phycocyanobilin lyase [Natronobacterium gregoryi SP2]SFJ33220.1 HEAT repeat-containing protein [Natronobacterium gregoryi]